MLAAGVRWTIKVGGSEKSDPTLVNVVADWYPF
jgi:hypothetical protein